MPKTSRALSVPSRLVVLVLLAWSGCTQPKNTYWERQGGTDKQFHKVSLHCNEHAADRVVAESSGSSCGYNTEGRGTYCTQIDPNDPAAVDAEKRRRERRMAYLYND